MHTICILRQIMTQKNVLAVFNNAFYLKLRG